MRSIRQMIYNASIISLFQELYKKYPHPIVIYDNSTDESFESLGPNYADNVTAAYIDIYQTLSALNNSQWISKSLKYENSTRGPHLNGNSMHVFCVDNVSDSVHLIRDKISRTSNNYRIQNIILFNDNHEPPHSGNIFKENERFHRNTMLCRQRTKINITCWYWTQQIDRINPTLTDLLYAPVNLNLLEIQISAYAAPPNAFTSALADRCIFCGLNAMVTAEILAKFNATPRYCNYQTVKFMKDGFCNKSDKMNEDDALKLLRRLKVDRKGHYNLIHTVFDSRMIKYLFFERGKCMGPPVINMNIAALNEKNNMTALVPTELSCISVIVPRADAATSFLQRMFYSVESITFLCTVLLFSMGRILISKSTLAECFDIFYSTFVVYLNQTSLKPKTEAERILYGFLLALSIITTVMLSGLIFTNMVNNPSSKPIQTVNDLAASEYRIFGLDNAGNWMNNLRDDIRAKVTLVSYLVIREQLNELNKTAALAINENVLGLLKRSVDSPNLYSKFRNDFYEMREKLHCGYFTYRISENFTMLEDDINQILHQMVEHGFLSAFRKWTMHIMKLVDLLKILSVETSAPINFGSSHGIFYLYLCGNLLSSVAFVCEKLCKWIRG